MRKLVLGALAVSALSLAMGTFTANSATKTPHGFTEGKASWKTAHQRPPGWSRSKGEKTGWGKGATTPPGLRR